MKYRCFLTGVALILLFITFVVFTACKNPFLPPPNAPETSKDKRTVISSAGVIVTAPVLKQAPDNEAEYEDEAAENHFNISEVTWKTPNGSPLTGNFTRNVKYTAEVTLTAHDNYRFTEKLTAEINLFAAKVLNNAKSTVTISYEFDELAETAISSVSITITTPIIREEPVCEVDTLPANSRFNASAVSWKTAEGYPVIDIFTREIEYIAEITLTAHENYYFANNLTANINSHAAFVSDNTEETVTIWFKFGELIEVDYKVKIEFDPINDILSTWDPGVPVNNNEITIQRRTEGVPTELIISLTGTYSKTKWTVYPLLENENTDLNPSSFIYTFDDDFTGDEIYTLMLTVWTDEDTPYSRTLTIKVVGNEN